MPTFGLSTKELSTKELKSSHFFPPKFIMQDCRDKSVMKLIMIPICQANLLPIPRFKKGDEAAASTLDQAEPLVSFALCSGSKSSPVVSTQQSLPVVVSSNHDLNKWFRFNFPS